nr:MAG: replication initiator protein [Microvirus sp.]
MICFRPIWMVLEKDWYEWSQAGKSKGLPEKTAIPCGSCDGCRMSRAQMWSNRMFWEADQHESTIFGTFTFAEDPKEVHPKYLQTFFKRIRKTRKVKYFANMEYGETYGRPHAHAVIFGLGMQDKQFLEEKWGHGNVEISPYIQNRGLYTAGYLLKQVRADIDLKGKHEPFCVMSQGIGKEFALKNKTLVEQRMLTIYGKKVGVPRYYRESLGIQLVEAEDPAGEIYDIHVMRTGLDPIKDRELIQEEVEKSRKQTELNWKSNQTIKRHENGL